MNPLAENNEKSPLWMQELLDQIKSMTFIADDEEAVLHRCLMAPDICEAPLSYDKLEELDEEDDFTRELGKLVNAKWTGTKRELCEKALLLENTFYKIQAGKRLPGRDTTICLALALGLNMQETKRLLGYLGYGLGEHIKRDFIIMYCLEKGKSPLEVNLVLEKCGLRLLGPND
ncbi:MAG TPA: hypothetical protein GXZ98_10365 [Firmicutes bacterium]|nr:hypothetical protein [Bacillota bacterium]